MAGKVSFGKCPERERIYRRASFVWIISIVLVTAVACTICAFAQSASTAYARDNLTGSTADSDILQSLKEILWLKNTSLGQSIIVAIGTLFSITILCWLLHFTRYHAIETSSLRRVERKVGRWKDEQNIGYEGSRDIDLETEGEITHQEAEESEYEEPAKIEVYGAYQALADVDELKAGISSRSIMGKRLSAIAKMRSHHVKVNVNTLQQMSLAGEASKMTLGFPGFFIGIAMMLGMLGTFIGLAMMVRKIGLVLPSAGQEITMDSWADSIGNIKSILSGMNTAFSTTLVGIFCAIIATILNFLLQKTQAGFFEKLERFTAEELLPATVPALEDESLLESVSFKLEDSFSRLDDILRQNGEILKDLNGVQRAFLSITSQIRTITKTEASRDLEGVIGQLGSVSNSVGNLVAGLPQIAQAMRDNNTETMGRIESIMNANREQVDKYTKQLRRFTGPGIAINFPSVAQSLALLVIIIASMIAVHILWR